MDAFGLFGFPRLLIDVIAILGTGSRSERRPMCRKEVKVVFFFLLFLVFGRVKQVGRGRANVMAMLAIGHTFPTHWAPHSISIVATRCVV